MGDNIYYSYITKLKMLGIQFSDNVIADTEDTKVIEVSINPDGDSVDKPIRYFMVHKSTGLAEEIAEDCQNSLRAKTGVFTGLSNIIIMYNKNNKTYVFGYDKKKRYAYGSIYNAIDAVILASSFLKYYTVKMIPDVYSITKINGACNIHCDQNIRGITIAQEYMPLIKNISHPELMQYASKRDVFIHHSKSNIEIALANYFGNARSTIDVCSIIDDKNKAIKLIHKVPGRTDTDITDLKCHNNYTKNKLAVAISDVISNLNNSSKDTKDTIIIGIIDNEDTSCSQFFGLFLYNMHIIKNELKDNIQIINITGSIVGDMPNQDKARSKVCNIKIQYNIWVDYNISKVYMNGYIIDREIL